MTSQGQKSEPDPDSIKMFVGQIPRSMDENDLRKMFSEFGDVFQLNVLRDKDTGQSKGCCFVTFYTRKSALEAQNLLHNIKTMPGMQHPIQMKPADSEKRNEERKLFIGMIAKKCSENEVRMMFAPFGQIEECTVLREQNGQSKGCAFVTYASRQCAQNAIKAMHHSQTMEGCRSPLVVKFADTPKDKEMKKLQQMNASLLSMANLASLGAIAPQYGGSDVDSSPSLSGLNQQYQAALLQQAAAAGNLGALGNLGNVGQQGVNMLQVQQLLAAASAAAQALQNNPGDSSNVQALQNIQGLAALANLTSNPGLGGLGMQNLAALNQLAAVSNPAANSGLSHLNSAGSNSSGSSTVGTSALTGTSSSLPVGSGGGLASLQGLTAPNGHGHAPHTNGIGGHSLSQSQSSADTLSQAYSGIQQYAASFPNAFQSQSAAQLQQAAANSPAGKQTEGPDGANLFIYHLPQEFGDHDLMQMFMPFGSVVSAKVFIDKQTNLSKCFGFTSYDNPVSAQAAIQAMNGFQIGMKRLKVQLKRPKSDSKPY